MATKSKNNTNASFLWNSPSLMVPMDVEALVVSEAALLLTWASNTMKYNNAGKFKDVTPSMFLAEKPKIGVTLHWALPDGITHGKQEKDSTNIKYPYAPNRWLIIRYYEGKSKAWILQSDFISPDPNLGSNLFLDPNAPNPTPTYIGKAWAADQWPGEASVTQQKFLQALGPGNPAFAAYTANINNVFSFYDDMSDIIDRALPITYSVAGWYAKAEDDPMADFASLDDWKALMDKLEWTVGNSNDLQKAVNDWMAWAKANNITIDPENVKDLYPSRTICQGMVYNVNWLGQTGKEQSGVPKYDPSIPANKQPWIAVGNTAIDALAALVQYELDVNGEAKPPKPGEKTPGQAAAELLEAFNYNLLDKYEKQGGQFELYREIYKAWFGNHDAEFYYYIEDKDKPADPHIDADRLANLVTLNRKSETLNLKQHLLKAVQQGLFNDWWKKGKSNDYWGKDRPPGVDEAQWKKIKADITAALPTDKTAVTTLQQNITNLEAEIKGLEDLVKTGLPTTQKVVKNVGNRYHQPNDPVVLIYGAKRNFRHGEDGRFDERNRLLTRFTGQNLSGLIVRLTGQKDQPVVATNVTLPPVNLPAANLIPKETGDLAVETFFVSTLNAEAIAKAACTLLGIAFQQLYADDVKKQQTSAWNADVHRLDRQLVTDASGFMGTIPSKIAVQSWLPPWAPLYMAWEIRWFPSYTTPSEALQKWTFNPQTLEYEWNTSYTAGSQYVTYTGSSLITPKSAFVMQAKLEKYFEETGSFPDLKKFLNTVSHWDFLTQSMSGLNDALLAFTPNQLNQPPADTAPLVGEMKQLTPIPDQGVGFYPIRAGQFQIVKLWIVDDFGQVFDPISAVGQDPGSYKPILGTGMVYPLDKNLVQLPPRVTQPSRFNFNFVGGNGGVDTIQQNQTVNPLCGWLLPNHLDKGLSIYSPDGHLLGELLLTGSYKKPTLRWDTAPGKNIPVGAPLESIIENEYLRDFVQKLLKRTNSADSFNDFLAVIDETLWTVEPLGGRKNELISVFIGRPLALVKATMKYEMMDGPVYSQSWLNSTLKVTGGYESIKFPIQIGSLQDPQDGTIGYYFRDFETFNTIHTPPDKDKDGNPIVPSGYITDNPVSLNFTDNQKDVYILVDPRGEVNAISGILPVQVNVLPGTLVEDAMSNMHVTFRTGPLITDPDKLAMPLPSQMSGKWSWIQHTGVTTWEEIKDIGQANVKAHLGTDYVLKDGWLKLSNAIDSKDK